LFRAPPQSDRGPVTHRSPRDRPSELNEPLAPRIALRLPTRFSSDSEELDRRAVRSPRRQRSRGSAARSSLTCRLCFLDDVGIGRRGGPTRRYRMRMLAGLGAPRPFWRRTGSAFRRRARTPPAFPLPVAGE
jgi:hypothetical protein